MDISRAAVFIVLITSLTLAGCSSGGGGEGSGASSKNIPDRETLTMSIDSAPAVEYVETQDASLPSGYKTKLAVHTDNTRIVQGVATPTPTINLRHTNDDGSKIAIYMYLPMEAPGSYVIDDTTRFKFTSYTNDNYKFKYRAEAGQILISEYGEIGAAVVGTYDVTLSCAYDYPECVAGELIHATGEFVIIRDETQMFPSVGSAADPYDLGNFPVQSYYFSPYEYDGENYNLVSPSAPSYYKFTVKSLQQYTITLDNFQSSIKLSVYDNANFDTPICEPNVITVSCTATAQSDALYFSVAMLNTTLPGTWFTMDITQSSFSDEGSSGAPVDISDQDAYYGQVDTAGSYYKFSVTPGTMLHVSADSWYGSSSMQISTDNSFSNILCEYLVNVRGNSCNIQISDTTTELFVHMPPDNSGTGFYFIINHWEITSPLYYIDVLHTPVTGNNGPCAGISVFEADGFTRAPGLQIDYNSGISDGASGNLPLENGNTYYIRLYDCLGHYQHPVDYYTLWVGTAPFAGSLQAVTPEELLYEPANDVPAGATEINPNTLYYDSFKSTDDDTDWFKITIPIN